MIEPFEFENSKAMESVDTRDEEAPLVAGDNSAIQSQNNHTRDVYILSFAFLFIFLAYGAAQNLQSTVNTVRISSLPFLLSNLVDLWIRV